MERTILVVDDEPRVADLVAELLADEGYRVRLARDGMAALDEVARDPPDLVVSDVMMPRLDGLTLTQRLRAQGSGVPVVLMSAVYADVDIPGVRFVPKPFDIAEVVAVVNRVFDELAP